MGAGNRTDHYIQDTAEKYLVAVLQRIAEERQSSLDNSANARWQEYEQYANDRGVLSEFAVSDYKANIDATASSFFDELVEKYPHTSFAFLDVECDSRNSNGKQDMLIVLSKGDSIPVSVKNYRNGFSTIQLCAGTFTSFLTNFAFDTPAGVGNYIHPLTGKKFKGAQKVKRDDALVASGMEKLIGIFDELDEVNRYIKLTFQESPDAQYWVDICDRWETECEAIGHKGAKIIMRGLDLLPNIYIRNRIIKMAGLDTAAELLVMGKGQYMCTLTNDRYGDLVHRVTQSTGVRYSVHQKGIQFSLFDDSGDIVSMYVPLTLNKNGGWNLEGEPYEGVRLHESESKKARKSVYLAYGERRPRKSKEIATSTNFFLDLKKAGVL